jgi:hypothetical protein
MIRISSFDGSDDLSMSINNIIDASHDLKISVGHNITYLRLSIKYYPDYLI